MKYIAIYARVSSDGQSTKSQEPDLKRWAEAQNDPVRWYRDTFTGKTMDRPGWQKLVEAMGRREVATIVVWRLDRLGRTARGLTALFEDLQTRKIGLVSLKDGLDLATPAGRLMANVIASVAQYANEVRTENQRAGIEAKRDPKTHKCPWGGSKPGRRIRLTQAKERTILRNWANGENIATIAQVVGLGRQTVYRVLRRHNIKLKSRVAS